MQTLLVMTKNDQVQHFTGAIFAAETRHVDIAKVKGFGGFVGHKVLQCQLNRDHNFPFCEFGYQHKYTTFQDRKETLTQNINLT